MCLEYNLLIPMVIIHELIKEILAVEVHFYKDSCIIQIRTHYLGTRTKNIIDKIFRCTSHSLLVSQIIHIDTNLTEPETISYINLLVSHVLQYPMIRHELHLENLKNIVVGRVLSANLNRLSFCRITYDDEPLPFIVNTVRVKTWMPIEIVAVFLWNGRNIHIDIFLAYTVHELIVSTPDKFGCGNVPLKLILLRKFFFTEISTFLFCPSLIMVRILPPFNFQVLEGITLLFRIKPKSCKQILSSTWCRCKYNLRHFRRRKRRIDRSPIVVYDIGRDKCRLINIHEMNGETCRRRF